MYNWLGNGIYFWENNLLRAKEWATRRYGEDSAVVGAVIDLGLCLNLTDSASEGILKEGYKILKSVESYNLNAMFLKRLPNFAVQGALNCIVVSLHAFGSNQERIHSSPVDGRNAFVEWTADNLRYGLTDLRQ